MCRGSSWASFNWLVFRALRDKGYQSEAAALYDKTIQLLGCNYEAGKRVAEPSFFECYNPHTGEPYGNENLSWDATVIDMILEYEQSSKAGSGPEIA